MRKLSRVGLLVLVVSLPTVSAGDIRYLSNAGDDLADGRTPATAWRTVEKMNRELPAGGTALLRRGDTFYGRFQLKGGSDAAHRTTLSAYGEGRKPIISCLKTVKPFAWECVSRGYGIWRANLANPSNYTGIATDDMNPGFLLVDGVVQPWRKFCRHDVNRMWDFAGEDGWLYVHATNNPAMLAKEIRVSLRVDGVYLDSHTAVSNVCVFGTGAHGMQGGWGKALKDIRIADCDFENIGGSELPNFSKSMRVRYGNGIEFGDGCDGATVERCTFRGVYDVAFTMQGRPAKSGGWRDVVCRDCTMTDCTQAFEIWCQNAPKGIGYQRCAFTGNRTKRVGGGWGALSRPDQMNRTPLLVYAMDTDTVDIDVSGNTFEDCPIGIIYKSGGIDQLPRGYRIHDNAMGTATRETTVYVDATQVGKVMPNTSQVLTAWNGVRRSDGTTFDWHTAAAKNRDYPITNFVRYVELMACTGGSKDRDLFKDANDRTTLDDYDFRPLVDACRGILDIGFKPYLKLGNVPAKFSSGYDGGEFSMNIHPPTDDLVHYRYMKACAAALKAAFGTDEVRSWRFAVLTEADNTGWFKTKSGSRDELREAFFRLYDYAARAFEEELGRDLVFGTHLLYPGDPCAQSQFSVEEFVSHCSSGTNVATGGVGAPLRLLTASYYGVPDHDDLRQGCSPGIRRLRQAVDKAGFKNVVLGVDEGRVIFSAPGRERRDLQTRAVGASYQAAFDVRVIKEVLDIGGEYFATWGYFTGPDHRFEGVPCHHYFSSRELAKLAGLSRVAASVKGGMPEHEELDAIGGVSADGCTVRAVVARFRDKLVFTNRLSTAVSFRLPESWAGLKVSVRTLILDDRNNWFCDWQRDRRCHGISDADFDWSPDDFAVLSFKNLRTARWRELFSEQLQPVYAQRAASVRPSRQELTVGADGIVSLPVKFVGNGAAHIEIKH